MDMKASQSALSGLRAESTRQAVSANNVANVNTDGFSPQRVQTEEQAEGGVRVSISQDARALEGRQQANAEASATEERSGTDLVAETTTRIASVAAYEANLKTLQAADDTSGVVIRMGGSE